MNPSSTAESPDVVNQIIDDGVDRMVEGADGITSLEQSSSTSPADKNRLQELEERRRERRCPKFQLPHHIKNLFYEKSFYRRFQDPAHWSSSKKHLQLIHESPNIYLINNFLLESEINFLDGLITENFSEFHQSFTEDNEQDKIYSTERTSKFFFLTKSKDRIIRNIEGRAADLVGLPVTNVEPLQVIHYTGGQQFTTHHDAGTLLEDTQTVDCILPRRLVTLVIYLNSLPFGNGFTEFPLLNLSILPRKGQALLFCNILPSGEADFRVIHKANPVHSPLQKYGMNVWISEKPMPMESYELHRKPKKKRKLENEPKDVKKAAKKLKLKLLAAEQITEEFCNQHFVEEKEDLYFESSETVATTNVFPINVKHASKCTELPTKPNNQLLEEMIPTGKNYFLNLNSFADYNSHDKDLIGKILQTNKLSLPLTSLVPRNQTLNCGNTAEESKGPTDCFLYFIDDPL